MSERGPQLLKSHSHLTATARHAVLGCLCGHGAGRAHRKTPAPAVVTSSQGPDYSPTPTMSGVCLQGPQDPQAENKVIKQGRRGPREEAGGKSVMSEAS